MVWCGVCVCVRECVYTFRNMYWHFHAERLDESDINHNIEKHFETWTPIRIARCPPTWM